MGVVGVIMRTIINLRIWRAPTEPVPVTSSERLDAFIRIIGIIGFIGRGLLWLSVGGVAIDAAINLRPAQGPAQSVQYVASKTFGMVVSAIALIGIASYAFWRFTEGALGLSVDPMGSRLSRVFKGYIIPFGSALGYVGIGLTVGKALIGITTNSGLTSQWLDAIVHNIFGKILLTLAALILAGVAFGFIVITKQRI